jgi:hypothetical protein
VSPNQGSNFVSETFEGEAARNLFNLLGETPTQSTNLGEDNPESLLDHLTTSRFVGGSVETKLGTTIEAPTVAGISLLS